MTAADQSILAELAALLDCVQTDGTVSGLDEFQRDGLSTLGATLYDVLAAQGAMLAALERVVSALDAGRGYDCDVNLSSDDENAIRAAVAKGRGK